jgi:phosphatidylinositol alpha-1,6-mannosyltransferase
MMILASRVSAVGEGGVEMVNRLILEAAAAARMRGRVVALHDGRSASWLRDWPGAVGCGGSKARFAWAALRRPAEASGPLLVTHAGLAPVGRLVKMRAGLKLALFIHGVEAWDRPSRLRAWGLAAVDHVVANSHYTLRRFREVHHGLAARPAEVCYLPARRLASVATAAAERPDAPLRTLVVGRLWGRGLWKGQARLIRVWPTIVRHHPDAQLWIVGHGGGRVELERLASECGVAQAVRFTGGVSDDELHRLYASAHLYAMPSEGEGFGLVFAEAMAHGLPCVASRRDAGAEVVADGETGLVVDPGSHEELAAALRRLLGDAALRSRMGESGRRRAAELFTQEGFNARIISLLMDASTSDSRAVGPAAAEPRSGSSRR